MVMESDHFETSTVGIDVTTSIKQEPDDDFPQTVLLPRLSNVNLSQQHLADHNYCELEDSKIGILMIHDTLPVTSSGYQLKQDNVLVKSEPKINQNSSDVSNKTTVNCESYPNITQDIATVKNEISPAPCAEVVQNGAFDADSYLVEVPGELDCKPESFANLNNAKTDVQHNDTANQKLCASMKIAHQAENTTLDRGASHTIPRDLDDGADHEDNEEPSHRGSDVPALHCSNDNKQLSTIDDLVDVHEHTQYISIKDHGSVLCDKELCERTLKSISCTRCEKRFTSQEELTSHCATHKDAVTYKCNVCDKGLKCKSALAIHLRVHSGERPFQCDVCDKRFKFKNNLISHIRIHFSEQPFQCKMCNNRFKFKSNLTSHICIHSGGRLDNSHGLLDKELCEKTFISISCTRCEKRFASREELTLHRATHKDAVTHQCNVCDKSYKC